MITRSEAEAFKTITPLIIEFFPQGAAVAVVKGDVFDWVANSKKFPAVVFHQGAKIKAEDVAGRAMTDRKTITDKVAPSVYGVRMYITAVPVEEDNKIIGSLVIGVPQVSAIEIAFEDVATILSSIFAEGCMVYLTDTEIFTHRHGDGRFDLPAVAVGAKFAENGVASKSIREKRPTVTEIDASLYGEICLVGNFPLFDDGEVIGTFGIATPKRTAVKLRNMSVSLHEGMSQIAAAIEELAASSFEINTSEQGLNKNVQNIATLSGEINDILGFIKQIAEETKMLGVNAAIEAARAGEAGRGFGVVAEEIRRLSDESNETVSKIRGLTHQVTKSIEETIRNSTMTLRSSEEQAAATQEVTAHVEEMNGMAEELDKIAQVI